MFWKGIMMARNFFVHDLTIDEGTDKNSLQRVTESVAYCVYRLVGQEATWLG
jgi:hypothetical protein